MSRGMTADRVYLDEWQPHRIPALTLWRPWTTCILRHGKRIENRGWHTNYRGPVWLHAGQRWDFDALDFAAELAGVNLSANLADHPTGIVALVDLIDICSPRDTAIIRGDCSCGPWAARGQHHWQLDNVRALAEPIPARGMQGLWWPAGELADQLAEVTRA